MGWESIPSRCTIVGGSPLLLFIDTRCLLYNEQVCHPKDNVRKGVLTVIHFCNVLKMIVKLY